MPRPKQVFLDSRKYWKQTGLCTATPGHTHPAMTRRAGRPAGQLPLAAQGMFSHYLRGSMGEEFVLMGKLVVL